MTETVTVIRQQTETLTIRISSPIGNIKSPVGDNIPNWRFEIGVRKTITNPQLDEISLNWDLKCPIGDITQLGILFC